MPILGKNRRLRDFNYIKLFLIALVWSLTTAFIPATLANLPWISVVLISVERFLFFIAITIPFDIRDANIDKQIQVKTLAHLFDKTNNLRLAILSLTISILFIVALYLRASISFSSMTGLILIYVCIGILIHRSKDIESDYYYTGVLDGTMILSYLAVLAASLF